MYKKNFKSRRRFDDKPKRLDYEKTIEVEDAGRPVAETDVNVGLSFKALKDLPKAGSAITPKLDPYTSVLPDSYPYALLNRLNRPIGGKYSGDDNLDGGNTRQFMTSESSAFLHCFDVFSLACGVNYRYLPIKASDTTRGKQYTNEMIRAIDEIQSMVNATTFTNLAVNDYRVYCDIPTGTYLREATKEYFLSTSPAGLFQWLIYYQLILQTISGVITAFNKSRSQMGTMMRMSWNRETPRLNSFFGLLKKKSFLAQWDSLCYTLEGEYFDKEWMEQFNMIVALTSRRCNACTEPLLEMISHNSLPSKFKLTIAKGADEEPIFDSAAIDEVCAAVCADWPEAYKFTNLEGMIEQLSIFLSVQDTLAWVRNNSSEAETTRFDRISDIVSALTNIMNYFKPRMADLRTCLDVVARVGVNHWSKGVRLKVLQDTDCETYRNLIVEHLFQQIGGGSHVMTWNSKTYRWSGHSLWNMYTGVPEYDSKSGGAFLSFSTKELSTVALDARNYLPIAISDFSSIIALNRLGTQVELTVKQFDPKVNRTSARLVPISTMTVEMNIVTPKTLPGVLDNSMLMNACLKVFGSYNATTGEVTANTDIAVEPDILCFVTYEIEDLSNEMIAYARSKGPFVVNVGDKTNIGFLGM